MCLKGHILPACPLYHPSVSDSYLSVHECSPLFSLCTLSNMATAICPCAFRFPENIWIFVNTLPFLIFNTKGFCLILFPSKMSLTEPSYFSALCVAYSTAMVRATSFIFGSQTVIGKIILQCLDQTKVSL